MKKTISLLAFILAIKLTCAQTSDTVRVLFVGNSFTNFNNLPQVFQLLAGGAGKNVVIGAHMPSGISVGDTVQGAMAHMNNPALFNLIRNNTWDYLVLQDNQGRFARAYGVFSSASRVIEGHIRIRDSLLHYHPCAKMIWFAGWAWKAGYPPYANTGAGIIDNIYNNYRYLLDTASQVIAPIGCAWKRILINNPSIDLWSSDGVHPSLYGTCLTADVIYSTIFKSSASQSTYTASGLTVAQDSLFKNTAFQTVIDSLHSTRLDSITPSIIQVGNTLTIAGYNNCNWFLNGNFITANSGVLNISQAGNYSAIVYDQNNCVFRTLEYVASIPTYNASITNESEQISVFPNPSNGNVTIQSKKDGVYLITNELGQTIELIKLNATTNFTYKLDNLSAGVYFIVGNNNDKLTKQKIVIMH